MTELLLPHPWGEAWTLLRSLELGPVLGGGAPLVARWGHRRAPDMSVALAGRETLLDLERDDERSLAAALGGRLTRAEWNEARIAIGSRTLTVSIGGPRAFGAAETVIVEGQVARALTPAQVLHECLARGQYLWARDALDTAAAVTRDRTALAEAASSFALADLKGVASCWRSSNGARVIAMDAEPLLQNESGIEPARIGSEAAEAAINHRYRRIVIERSGDEVVVRRTTPAGPLADVACNANDVGQVLRRIGLLAHLDRNGPVSGAELLAAVRRHDGADQVSFDSVNEDSVHQVRRAAQPAA